MADKAFGTKTGELLQSAETETRAAHGAGNGAGWQTDPDRLEYPAGTAKMELQYVFQPGSGVQAAVQGRRITVNLAAARAMRSARRCTSRGIA